MLSKKKTILFGNFSQHGERGGGVFPNPKNVCKFTKYFFVCQIHSEVLKHVLQMREEGGGCSDILSISTFSHYSRILKIVTVILLQ